jgi:hypothetical protein
VVTQFFENGIFCLKFRVFEKTIRQKVTENWFFFWGGCRHIYAYWLQFSEFLEINSPVKSKLPKDTLPTSGNWKKNTSSTAATYIVSTLIYTTTLISLEERKKEEPCALNAEL